MALREPVYEVEIRGAGPGYHAGFAALERSTHLDLGKSYLVLGDEARASVEAHDGQGDVRVAAHLAGPSALGGTDDVEADTDDIEHFIEAVCGAPLAWDAAAGRWSLAGAVEASGTAASHREAALSALKAALATQRR